jgi:hypothetical protein
MELDAVRLREHDRQRAAAVGDRGVASSRTVLTAFAPVVWRRASRVT